LTATGIGILMGAVAGYYGGGLDDVLMRVTEWFLVIPQFFLVLIIAALFGPRTLNVVLVIGLLGWPPTARLIRAQFLTLREREFVLAARTLGAGDLRIILRQILPNGLAPAIVSGSLQVAAAVLIESNLRFLGLSDPNVVSWGGMLNSAQRFLFQLGFLHHPVGQTRFQYDRLRFPEGALCSGGLGVHYDPRILWPTHHLQRHD